MINIQACTFSKQKLWRILIIDYELSYLLNNKLNLLCISKLTDHKVTGKFYIMVFKYYKLNVCLAQLTN